MIIAFKNLHTDIKVVDNYNYSDTRKLKVIFS